MKMVGLPEKNCYRLNTKRGMKNEKQQRDIIK